MPLASATASPWVRGVMTLIVYVATGLASVALSPTVTGVSQLYLAAGFGLALVIGWGRAMAIPVGLGSALVNMVAALWFQHIDIDAIALICFASAGLGSGMQAWAAARWTQGADPTRPLPLDSVRDIGRFLLIAGPLACLISASVTHTLRVALGALPQDEWLPTWISWWAGDTLGVLIGAPIMLTLVGRPARLWSQRRHVLGLPLLAAAALLGLGIRQLQAWETERETTVFRQQAEATANAVRLRLMGYLNATEALRGVYDSSETVTRQEFRRAAHHWLTQFQGIQALGWEERVPSAQLRAFELAQRADGLPDYRVFDMPNRQPPSGTEAVALRFIEPLKGNERALGYNVLSRESTRDAYMRAIALDEPVATAVMTLAQEAAQQQGVVIYRPVYHPPGTPLNGREDRVRGAVFLALRMDDALAAILKGSPGFLQVCLLDSTAGTPVFMAGDPACRDGRPPQSPFSHAVSMPFAQRTWTLQMWATHPTPVSVGPASSWLFAVGGVALAAALGALLLVITGTTERMTAAIEEARQQREAAEAANRAKSEFLSRMSHELRTPLNAMLGFSQVMGLDRQHPLDGTQSSRLDQIQQAGWHLLDMIDDVLDLSRIDTGTLRLHTEALALPAALDAAHNLVKELAARQGITVSVDGTLPALWGVQADETRLRQILTNLLSNAIKYNQPGGTVHVQATLVRPAHQPPMVNIVVTDSGLGMSEAQLAQLFQPFNRLGRERNSPDGTGIGLVISRHLALLMGGQLEAISTEGAGSTFTLSLPAVPLLPPPTLAEPATTATEARSDGGTTSVPRMRHVLYVEDNHANTALVQAALESRPEIVLTVAGTIEAGLAALHDRLRAPLPELILLDVHLPDASGLDFLNLVKANPATQPIPVVMISADAMPEQVDACLKAGAACYLTKPVQIDALLQQVDELLG